MESWDRRRRRRTNPRTPPSEGDEPADSLTRALAAGLQSGEAVFDFKVQLQADPVAMPVEDVTVEWDEATIRGLRHGAKN